MNEPKQKNIGEKSQKHSLIFERFIRCGQKYYIKDRVLWKQEGDWWKGVREIELTGGGYYRMSLKNCRYGRLN